MLKKQTCIIIAAISLFSSLMAVFFIRSGSNILSIQEDPNIGIQGYERLAKYILMPEPTIEKLALSLFDDLEIINTTDDKSYFVAKGTNGDYEGFYSDFVLSAFRMPIEQSLPDKDKIDGLVMEFVRKLGWDNFDILLETQNNSLYQIQIQIKIQDVPIEGFIAEIYIDAGGIQGVTVNGLIGSIQEIGEYNLKSLSDQGTVFIQFRNKLSEEVRATTGKLNRLDLPELTYVCSTDRHGELVLAWKMSFQEIYTDNYGETVVREGHYLVDAEKLTVIDRIEYIANEDGSHRESGALPIIGENENITQFGMIKIPINEVDDLIKESLYAGGVTIFYDCCIPDTPNGILDFTLQDNLPIDYYNVVKILFGENCDNNLEPSAVGSKCEIVFNKSIYKGVFHQGVFLNLLRMETGITEEGDYRNNAIEIAEQIMELLGAELFDSVYSLQFEPATGETWISFSESLGGIQISQEGYFTDEESGAIRGSGLIIKYDSYGITGVKIERPVLANPSRNEITQLISADEACQIMERKAETLFVDSVKIVKQIQLKYLNPRNIGESFIPVWEISYDSYRFGAVPGEVVAYLGGYKILIDAQTGNIHSHE